MYVEEETYLCESFKKLSQLNFFITNSYVRAKVLTSKHFFTTQGERKKNSHKILTTQEAKEDKENGSAGDISCGDHFFGSVGVLDGV